MSRTPVTIYPFVIVVVKRGDQFLLIQEANVSRGTWYFPAGGVEPGEGLVEAAIREAREEAGIEVIPRTLLVMEDMTRLSADGEWAGRWRFLIRAEPVEADPNLAPTKDAMDVRWFTVEEIELLPVRAGEVVWIAQAVARGCAELPLDVGYKRY